MTVHVLSALGSGSSCTVRSWQYQFMHCQAMETTVMVHVLSALGSDIHVLSALGSDIHVLSALGGDIHVQNMGMTVHVLSGHGSDSSYIMRPWRRKFRYFQPLIMIFRVMLDHGSVSSWTVSHGIDDLFIFSIWEILLHHECDNTQLL